MKPGRYSFNDAPREYSTLRTHCGEIISRVLRTQCTHAEYLQMRKELTERTIWAKSTYEARRQAFTYLDGAIDMVWRLCVKWKHKTTDGEWSELSWDSRIHAPADRHSAHVWKDSNKYWTEPVDKALAAT